MGLLAYTEYNDSVRIVVFIVLKAYGITIFMETCSFLFFFLIVVMMKRYQQIVQVYLINVLKHFSKYGCKLK